MELRRSFNVILLFALFGFAAVLPSPVFAEHPFIAVRASEYAAWQTRAASEPWATMKADALDRAESLSFESGAEFSVRCVRVRDICDAAALAYVLDPPNRPMYRDKIRATLLAALPGLRSERAAAADPNNNWNFNVPLSDAVLSAVLALDVIHDQLSPDDLLAIETDLEALANAVTNLLWAPSGASSRCLWSLYKGDAPAFNAAKSDHDAKLRSLFTPGGVFIAGNGYADARLSNVGRQAKSMFLDVLEKQGYGEYYTDPALIALHEYLFGYANSPSGRVVAFGDADNSWSAFGAEPSLLGKIVNDPQIFRAHRFSANAGSYAAWQLRTNGGTVLLRGRPLAYAAVTEPVSANARVAPSRIFDAYAGLIERRNSPESLYAGLLSLGGLDAGADTSHMHKEANAICLGAYGESLLRNAGYNGWGNGWGPVTWNWINNTAESGNTVLINNSDHVSKQGGGIAEGFVGLDLEYARGDSGGALGIGRHYRNLFFVHPADGADGYWIVVDQIGADTPSHPANVAWHPNAGGIAVEAAGERYLTQVGPAGPPNGPVAYSQNHVKLTTFLGTPAESVAIRSGALAGGANSFNAQYLYAAYPTNGAGKAGIVTVFYPHDDRHGVAGLQRISTTDYTGASVTQGSVLDVALASNTASEHTYGPASFQGEIALCRNVSLANRFYFIRAGRSFNDGATPRRGFASNNGVTVFMKETQGKIAAGAPSEVTFYYPGVTGLELNRSSAAVIESGPDWLKVGVLAGAHDVRLLPPLDLDPPAPSPAVFAVAPHPTDSNSVSMTAVAGSDESGPVEYYFEETSGNPGGADSGWQTSPTYENASLTPNTGYSYSVRTRDARGNAGMVSVPLSTKTPYRSRAKEWEAY